MEQIIKYFSHNVQQLCTIHHAFDLKEIQTIIRLLLIYGNVDIKAQFTF